MVNSIPQLPADNPLLGQLLSFRSQPLDTVERARDLGDLVRWRFGPVWFVQVNHPDLAREVLVRKNDAFHKTPRHKDVLRQILGEGLLVSDGEYWQRQRKRVQPAFHSQRIEAYGDVMVSHTKRMLERWNEVDRIDIGREMMELTLGIVCKTLFDAELEGEVYQRVDQAMEVALEQANDRFGRIWMPPAWLPTPGNLAMRRAVKKLDAVVMEIIEARRREGEDKGDLMSMLLLSQARGDGMSDQQVRDETMTLFLAGHETTANALTWTWTLLARNPDVLQRLADEVDRELAGRSASVADLDQLPYSDWVIQEAMRLYPPAWIIGRRSIEPVELGGQQLDEGTIFFISQWALHRDGRFFDQPQEFRPERFSPEHANDFPRYAYIPFGAGPRVCIGNNFAMMEARLLLASMVQQVELDLEPDQDLTPEPVVTLRPRSRIRMRVRRRQTLASGV